MIDIGLYIKLVTYARLYILTLVAPCCHVISYIYRSQFAIDIDYFVTFIFRLSYYCLHCFFMHEHLPLYTHTLIRSLLMTLYSHVQGIGHFLILFRCSCDRTLREELEFPSLVSGIPFSFYSFCTFLDFMYIRFSLYSSSFYKISCVDAYM